MLRQTSAIADSFVNYASSLDKRIVSIQNEAKAKFGKNANFLTESLQAIRVRLQHIHAQCQKNNRIDNPAFLNALDTIESEQLKELLAKRFRDYKYEATYYVLLSSIARLLQRLLPYCHNLETIISDIDLDIELGDKNLSYKILNQHSLDLRQYTIQFCNQEAPVLLALQANTYLSVDIDEEMSNLDSLADAGKRSMTLNPASYVSLALEKTLDVDTSITKPMVDKIIAPYLTDERMKKEAAENRALRRTSFNDPGQHISRQILHYRLPRESKARTSLSTNFFTSILTRNSNNPITPEETVYLTYCHGGSTSAANTIPALDEFALAFMQKNPAIKRVYITVGDYVGSAATKGKPTALEESANDTVRLAVKHWVQTKGMVGNDVVIGHSLGGLISAIAIDSLYREDHIPVTYYSVNTLANTCDYAAFMLSTKTDEMVASILGPTLVSISSNNYDYDVTETFLGIPKDHRRLMHAFNDLEVPFATSLLAHLPKNETFLENTPKVARLLAEITKYDKEIIAFGDKETIVKSNAIECRNILVKKLVAEINQNCDGYAICTSKPSDVVEIAIEDTYKNYQMNHGEAESTMTKHLEHRVKNLNKRDHGLFDESLSISLFRIAFSDFANMIKQAPNQSRLMLGFLYSKFEETKDASLKKFIGTVLAADNRFNHVNISLELAAECKALDYMPYLNKASVKLPVLS